MATSIAVSQADDLVTTGYDAYLFDWDGTLADSHAANFTAMQQALAQQGATLSAEWFNRHTGVSSRELAALVSRAQSIPIDAARAAADRDERYLQIVDSVTTIEPVLAALESARASAPVALATGGGARTVLATVDALGLRSHFDVIVTREDAALGKPAPDIFLEAARRLTIRPERCLVYEDSDQGVRAARAAGMDVLDVRALREDLKTG